MGVDKNNHMQCLQCQQFFESEEERDRHSLKEHRDPVCPQPQGSHEGHFICATCARHFGNHQTLQLHQQEHNKENAISEVSPVPLEGVEKNEEHIEFDVLKNIKLEIQTVQTSKEQLVSQSSAAARKVGLTKIRLEDCFRCDPCTCIYLEEEDYLKHMRNVHKAPLRKKQKKTCTSCCKNCNCSRGGHLSGCRSTNRKNSHVDIKDRLGRIAAPQPVPKKTLPMVKTETEEESCEELIDYSDLLSQVEVRIKTESEDENQQT